MKWTADMDAFLRDQWAKGIRASVIRTAIRNKFGIIVSMGSIAVRADRLNLPYRETTTDGDTP